MGKDEIILGNETDKNNTNSCSLGYIYLFLPLLPVVGLDFKFEEAKPTNHA